MIRIKICGITNLPDALAAVNSGTDALGFIFYKKSPRYITPENAGKIISRLPPFITTVGVFVNETTEQIVQIKDHCKLQVIQLHGNETEQFCKMLDGQIIKALRIKDETSLDIIKNYSSVSGFLLDTFTPDEYGGSGKTFNWQLALKAKKATVKPIILAGGLTPLNIEEAVRLVKPYGIDTSSGVEQSEGKKNHKLVTDFILRARSTTS